ncbi:Aquaporin-2 [Erysiphe neolycopersici]|uniref:Aquaporin-2 n=1 Tax=Erysiphe neolycopersici TaxID=212602 RepID=A0A420HUF8_9PEZI|nr:Aquaporin-2 [Erysiphe neolycopersici]
MSSTQEQGEVQLETANSSRRSSLSIQEQAPSLNMPPVQPRQVSTPPPDAPIISPSMTVGLQHDPNQRQGLRRKLSDSPRRSFQSDFERPDLYRYSSRRRLRQEDERDREYYGHPDGRERARPPRTYRNMDNGLDGNGGPPARPNFNENGDDLERGQDVWPHNFDSYSPRDGSFDNNYYERKQRERYPEKPAGREMNGSQPWASILNSNFKNHFVSALGEFVGTTMFLFFGFAGAQVANIGTREEAENPSFRGRPTFDIAVYLYISFVFGFSLLVNVWIFYRISGAQFNPAVTLALFLVGAVPIVRAVLNIIAQLLGAIAASALVMGLFPIPLSVRTSLGSGTSLVQGVFIEAILTAELVFTILMLAKEKHRATFLAPLGIGLALFVALLVGINFTGGSLNPARSFGPCVVTATFEDEHWIYWVGPTLGALIAVAFYKLLVLLEYEMVNPGQDGDDKNDPTKNETRYQEIISRRNKIFS